MRPRFPGTHRSVFPAVPSATAIAPVRASQRAFLKRLGAAVGLASVGQAVLARPAGATYTAAPGGDTVDTNLTVQGSLTVQGTIAVGNPAVTAIDSAGVATSAYYAP